MVGDSGEHERDGASAPASRREPTVGTSSARKDGSQSRDWKRLLFGGGRARGAGVLELVLVFGVVFLAQLPYFRLWLNFMDEGHMLQFADMVQNGGEFYRDATFYPLPGAFYFMALVFKVFGTSIGVSRWVVMIQFSLMVVLVIAYLRRMVTLPYAALGVAAMLLYRVWCFPHWQIYSYSTTSLLVLFTSLLLLLRFFESGRRRVLAASGFVYGLGVLCKQDYGAAALVAVVAGFAAYRRSLPSTPGDRGASLASLLMWFFLPAAFVGALTGLHYWRVGILDELLRFTVFNHFVGMSSYQYMEFPDLFPLFGQDLAYRTKLALMDYMPGVAFTMDWSSIRMHWLFTSTPFYDYTLKAFIYGPPWMIAAGALRLWRRRNLLGDVSRPDEGQRYLRELLLLVFAAGLLVLVWVNKPQDYLHLAVLYWPLICLGILYLASVLRGRRVAALVTALVLLLPAKVVVDYSARLLSKFQETHTELIPGERAGIYVKPKEASMMAEVVDYLRENTAPDERVAAIPYFPIVNFLAERLGPHRSAYIVWPFPELPDRDERIVRGMEETGTDVVIYNFTQFFSFSPVWEHAPILFAYLVDNFEIDRVFSHDAWGYKLVGLRRIDPGAEAVGQRIIPEDGVGVAIRVDGAGPSRPIPPEARPQYLQEMLWPFRRVVSLRPSAGGRRSVVSVPLSVPEEGGRIRSAVAVHPQWWFKLPPSWIEFALVVESGGAREEIFRKRISPTIEIADLRWFEIDLPLDAYAGREITLEFSNEAERPQGETLWMGGWEVPRLLPASGSTPPPPAPPTAFPAPS